MIGEIWNRTKEKQAESGQTDLITRKEVANNCNTSESTVKRAGSYAKNVSDIVQAVPSAQAVMDNPTTPRTIAKPLAQIAKDNPQKAQEIVDSIASVETDKEKKKVFEKAVGDSQEVRSSQSDSTKPKLKKIALSSQIIELVKPIAKANNLPISTQIENLIKEYLEETRE